MASAHSTRTTPRWLAVALAGLVGLEGMPAQPAAKLRIVIVEGEGAINNIRLRTAREPIVQVEDENRKPVAGAVVVFLLPDRGASGVFPNGSGTLTVTTDAQGRAVARGLRPNNVAGQVEIRVTASYEGQTASAVITQSNTLGAAPTPAGGVSGKLIAIIAVAAGAAAGGILAATRGGNAGSSSPAQPPRPPVSIAPGSGTVGPPR